MTEDELIERIARALDYPSVYMGGASQQSKLKARRAILPFIHEARIEGGKMVREEAAKCAETTQTMTVHGRKCNCVTCELNETEADILALNVEGIVKSASA